MQGIWRYALAAILIWAVIAGACWNNIAAEITARQEKGKDLDMPRSDQMGHNHPARHDMLTLFLTANGWWMC